MYIELIGKNKEKAFNIIYDMLKGTVRFPYIITKNPNKFSIFPSKFIYDTYNEEHITEIINLQKLSIKKGLENRKNIILINDIPLAGEYEDYLKSKIPGMYIVSTVHTNIIPDMIYITDIPDRETYNYTKSYWKEDGFDKFLKNITKGEILQIDNNGTFSKIKVINPIIDLWLPELE